MTIHELQNPLPVATPHGDGVALFLYDYHLNVNSVFGVRLDKTGEYKHYYSDDIRIYGNPMSGEETVVPEEWNKKPRQKKPG
jgi:hypothetical protein